MKESQTYFKFPTEYTPLETILVAPGTHPIAGTFADLLLGQYGFEQDDKHHVGILYQNNFCDATAAIDYSDPTRAQIHLKIPNQEARDTLQFFGHHDIHGEEHGIFEHFAEYGFSPKQDSGLHYVAGLITSEPTRSYQETGRLDPSDLAAIRRDLLGKSRAREPQQTNTVVLSSESLKTLALQRQR